VIGQEPAFPCDIRVVNENGNFGTTGFPGISTRLYVATRIAAATRSRFSQSGPRPVDLAIMALEDADALIAAERETAGGK